MPLSHIAEVTHARGFFWDSISVESSGGLNPLVVTGLPNRRPAISSSTSASASTPPPLLRRRRRHLAVELEPLLADGNHDRLAVLDRPARIISANGSCTDFWITRLSGRAP